MGQALGSRGEAIFYTLMTEFDTAAGPIFRPRFLGGEWPTVDFMVQLAGAEEHASYFFVQVKTTRRGFTSDERRLRVRLSERDMRRLASLPAPTYVAGIDEHGETGYLLSANGEHEGPLSSIPSCHPITRETRGRLWTEVAGYWKARAGMAFSSEFTDPAWRRR